jgi:hypothetical protein
MDYLNELACSIANKLWILRPKLYIDYFEMVLHVGSAFGVGFAP